MEYKFTDLVDISHLEKLMVSACEITGLLNAVLDSSGNILSKIGWQDICNKFHRNCPQTESNCRKSDSFICEHLLKEPFIGYKCINGLMDYATPIIVEGQHLATIFIGQLLHEPPDEEFFRRQASKYGFDETAYMEALRRVPVIPKERVVSIMSFYSQLAQLLATLGLEKKRELIRSEDKYRTVFENSGAGTFIIDRDLKIIMANMESERIFGFKKEEIEGSNAWTEFLYKEDFEKIKEYHSLRMGNPGSVPKNYQISVYDKNGNIKELYATAAIIPDTELTAVSLFDVTQQKQSKEALRQSEERFYKVFDNSPDIINIIGMEDGRYIEVNKKFAEKLEYTLEEVIGRTPEELNIFIDENNLNETFFRKLSEQGNINNVEIKLRTKSGEIITTLCSTEIININDEICWLTVLKDITGEKKMEAEMARLDRLNLVGEMAAGIGHEIRNPMTAVKGYLQLFQEKEEFANYREQFNLMVDELDRANSIITEYLSLAKNKVTDLKRRSINKIIKSISPLLQADALKEDKTIVLELEDTPLLLLDEKEIRQVIINLVRNGLEAMQPGGSLFIGTFHEGREVVLSVRDQGPGISDEILEKLGTPFFTNKETGTGLGLAVCYSIAARHNAEIEVDTGPAGTTFQVRFKI
ncbi:PocR ligand-binding domain-containing protein [Pelotomaculum propionicicum]|uniref:PocR ligand-binding domain-containing protein n=1 Tax=Pelotomaculum propionicicum TaxID=258475 RepID=UPI003B768ECA